LAVSPSGNRWILVNVSPDVREQINRTDAFHKVEDARGTTIDHLILTDAEIDHSSGVLFMREADELSLHTTSTVRHHLSEQFNLLPTVSAFTDCTWNEISFEEPFLSEKNLTVESFPVAGFPPSYSDRTSGKGDTVGLEFVDESTELRVVYLPALTEVTDSIRTRVEQSDLFLLDGTFWENDEMESVGKSDRRATDMGHLPVSGENGSLEAFRDLEDVRKIYVHINNTNPILHPDSPERQRVESAGFEVSYDDMMLTGEGMLDRD
jgi:pyrroloquinoline quinone biosynthesis protein B